MRGLFWRSVLGIGVAVAAVACGNVATQRETPPSCKLETAETPVESAARESSVLWDDRYAVGITADPRGVYWSADQGAVRMLAHGASQPQTLFQRLPRVSMLALDGDAIYFVTPTSNLAGVNTLFRLPREGGGPSPLVGPLNDTAWQLLSPVLDADRVYFANNSGYVASVSKHGGEPVDTAVEIAELHGLAVDETHLYWLEGEPSSSELKRVPKAGGAPELLASGFRYAGAIPRVIGDSVFLTAEHGLFAVPKTGGCPRTVIYHELNNVGPFLFESDQIYYARTFGSDTVFSSGILRMPSTGGTAVELTQGGFRSAPLSLDFFADRIYWSSEAAVYVLDL